MQRYMVRRVNSAIRTEPNPHTKEEMRQQILTEKGELVGNGYNGEEMERFDAFSLGDNTGEMYYVEIADDITGEYMIFYGVEAIGVFLSQRYSDPQILCAADKMSRNIKLTNEESHDLYIKFHIDVSRVLDQPHWIEVT